MSAAALDRAAGLLESSAGDTLPGYIDLLGGSRTRSTGRAQDLMLSSAVPRVYERWWRPALGRVAKGVLGPGMAGERRIAHELLDLSKGDTVLDVACGTGGFTRDFGRAVGPSGLAVGIDVSETMLARAAREAAPAQVAYVRGDAEELPFMDSTFDAVCCFAALHLFEDPWRALDRMAAVLVPGGRLAVFTSVRGRSVMLRAFESAVQARSGMRMFEADELVRALEARGFVDVRRRLTGMTQFVGARQAGTG